MKEDFDVDVEGEYGFEPAVSATGTEPGQRPRRRKRTGRRSLRRRLTAAAVLFGALAATGAGYAAFATSSNAGDTTSSAQDIEAGHHLYETSCIACHGANLQGVKGRGAPLIGVGGSAVYFQVTTGRMPAAGQGSVNERKPAKFTEKEAEQLAAFIESIGGGPTLPQGSLRDADIAEGGNLFRLNCASCHGTTFKGAPLSGGKYAPSLNDSTDKQIFAAMQTGPENMPIFSDNQLTPLQKRQIIGYIQTLKASKDPGGHGIDRIGPVSEAIVIWVGGVGALMIAILWIGAKSQ